MLSGIILNVVMLSGIILNVVMLSGIILNVVKLNVAAPRKKHPLPLVSHQRPVYYSTFYGRNEFASIVS
jgi:hypothetical protein